MEQKVILPQTLIKIRLWYKSHIKNNQSPIKHIANSNDAFIGEARGAKTVSKIAVLSDTNFPSGPVPLGIMFSKRPIMPDPTKSANALTPNTTNGPVHAFQPLISIIQ